MAASDPGHGGLALGELRREEPRRRPRIPWWPHRTVALVAAGAIAAAGFVVFAGGDDDADVGAPTITVGTADLVVVSSTFDDEGARATLPPELVDAVRGVSGVQAAAGVLRRFIDVLPAGTAERANDPRGPGPTALEPASDRSTVALSWDPGTDLQVVEGAAPVATDELAVNQVLAQAQGLAVGSSVELSTNGPYSGGEIICEPFDGELPPGVPPPPPNAESCRFVPRHVPRFTVTGIFTLPGGDVEDIRLAAFPAQALFDLTDSTGYDRIDIALADGADPVQVQQGVAAVLPEGVGAVSPTALGSAEQLRAELEIQRAYHWLLSPDPLDRAKASEAGPSESSPDTGAYERFAEEAKQAELRVSRVSFLDATTAAVTYVIYYGGSRSPIIRDPQEAIAVVSDGAWRISRASQCRLASLGGLPCTPEPGEDPAALNEPPNGWERPEAAAGAVAALRTLADPAASVDARVAAVQGGEALRSTVEEGVRNDARRADAVFYVVGARLVGSGQAEVLYTVYAPGDPPLETPYAVIGRVALIDGRWQADAGYACGLVALAQGGGCVNGPAPTYVP